MIVSDIIAVFQWWLVIFVIGIGFLPITLLIFSRFFDKGYIFSKTLGIAFATYVFFLPNIIHVIIFNQTTVAITLFFTVLIFYYFIPLKWRVIYLLKNHFKIFIFEEILFLSALFAWAYIHSFSPDIHGLEKYMDYGFINSMLRMDFLPPKDMWFTPEFINYYYYGHYITAFLIKLSGLDSAISFNLMLSTIFALCFTQTFSIGANLFVFAQKKLPQLLYKLKLVIAGLLTALLVTLAGNLHIIYSFFKPYATDNPKPPWELLFSWAAFPNSYWYPNATRFIHNTIHEFPVYSWVVADLHGHVLDIPFVILIIALLLAIFVSTDSQNPDKIIDEKWKKTWFNSPLLKKFSSHFVLHPLSIVLLGFLLAVMYMTNAWDGAIYLLLASLVIFYLLWEKVYKNSQESMHIDPKVEIIARVKKSKWFKLKIPKSFWLFCQRLFLPIVAIMFVFFVFSFPYNYYFKPFVSGIGILCAPDFLTRIETKNIIDGKEIIEKGRIGPFLFEKDHCQHSHWWELLILYGFFYFFILSFLIFLIRTKKIFRIDSFVLLLILLSTVLIFLPEFIYVKDIYPAHYRANTMFKLVFQAFIMLSLCSAYIFSRIMQSQDQSGILRNQISHGIWRFIFFPISLVLIILVMTYPYLAIPSYYGNLLKTSKGLNGIKYLETLYPSDYKAILWLNAHVLGQPVILEAQGDSYTDYARVSSNTGLPTVLGWTVHEWLWRGDYGIPAPRINEVKDIYETKDLKIAKKLLEKYKVKYVFIGALEYEKYPTLSEEKFKKLGKIVFQKDRTKIYELK